MHVSKRKLSCVEGKDWGGERGEEAAPFRRGALV